MRDFLIKIALIILLFVIFRPTTVTAQLELLKSVDSTTILSGKQMEYVIQYRCANTTTHCNDMVIRDTLPTDLTFISFLDNPIHSSNTTYDATNHVVIFELNKENSGMGLFAGSTGEVKIYAQFPNGITPNNTLVNNTAFVTSSTATDTFSNVVPTTALATNPWALQKIGNGTAYLNLPYTYSLQVVDPTNGASGGLNMDSVTVVDTLPTGATFDSANNGGIYNMTNHTVTWNVGNLTVGNNSNNLQVTVTFSDATFTAGEIVTNKAIFLGQPVGDPSQTLQDTDEVTNTITATAPDATVSKSISGNSTPIVGDTLQFDINVENTGTTVLDTFYMHDTIPDALNLTKIETGTFTGANLTIRYQTNLNSSFQNWTGSPFDGSANNTLLVSDLNLAVNDYITILEYDFENVLMGFNNTAISLFAAVINPDRNSMVVDNGTVISNCAALKYAFSSTDYQVEDCASATVRDTIQPSVDFEKQGSSNNPISIGNNFSYVMILNIDGDFAMDSIVMIDTVPENMGFYQTESGGWDNLSDSVEVYYQTNLNSSFQTWVGSPYAQDSDTQLPVSALSIAANEYVTVIKWVFRNPQIGFGHDGNRPRLYGTMPEYYPNGDPAMAGEILCLVRYG